MKMKLPDNFEVIWGAKNVANAFSDFHADEETTSFVFAVKAPKGELVERKIEIPNPFGWLRVSGDVDVAVYEKEGNVLYVIKPFTFPRLLEHLAYGHELEDVVEEFLSNYSSEYGYGYDYNSVFAGIIDVLLHLYNYSKIAVVQNMVGGRPVTAIKAGNDGWKMKAICNEPIYSSHAARIASYYIDDKTFVTALLPKLMMTYLRVFRVATEYTERYAEGESLRGEISEEYEAKIDLQYLRNNPFGKPELEERIIVRYGKTKEDGKAKILVRKIVW